MERSDRLWSYALDPNQKEPARQDRQPADALRRDRWHLGPQQTGTPSLLLHRSVDGGLFPVAASMGRARNRVAHAAFRYACNCDRCPSSEAENFPMIQLVLGSRLVHSWWGRAQAFQETYARH